MDLQTIFSAEDASQIANGILAIIDEIDAIESDLSGVVPNLPGLDDFDAKFVTPDSIIENIVYQSANLGEISGGENLDFLVGSDLNDEISGQGGNDNLFGGLGSDQLSGGTGNDRIVGGENSDQITGDGGDDVLFFDSQDGLVDGGSGRDIGYATLSNASVTVDAHVQGLEVIVGSTHGDLVDASDAVELVYFAGGDGNDTMKGTLDDGQTMVFWGGAGADRIELDVASGTSDIGVVPGVLVANVADLTEANFHQFDLDLLGLGSSFDWSQIDAVVINPDNQDRIFVDGVELGVKQVDYRLIGYPNETTGFPPGEEPLDDLFNDNGQTVGIRNLLLDSRSVTSSSVFEEGPSLAVGDKFFRRRIQHTGFGWHTDTATV